MKGVMELAPRRCRCGARLAMPVHGRIPELSTFVRETKAWHTRCGCGSILIWSFPNVFKQSHVLEIGRTMEVIHG